MFLWMTTLLKHVCWQRSHVPVDDNLINTCLFQHSHVPVDDGDVFRPVLDVPARYTLLQALRHLQVHPLLCREDKFITATQNKES